MHIDLVGVEGALSQELGRFWGVDGQHKSFIARIDSQPKGGLC